jgi:predicted tellurium resistance membrane protein TerC
MFTVEGWVSLATLATLEIVLGIDNVIFVSIAASRLPVEQRARGRSIGLFLAMFLRVALLTILTWLASLTDPWFNVFGHDFSKRDLILAGGGLYLVYKASAEIGEMLVPHTKEETEAAQKGQAVLFAVIAQIAIVDVVFAIDSIITAVGMTDQLPIMITAVVGAVAVMMFASGVVSHFIEKNPSTKMLALAFLVFVGGVLVADGLGFHIPRSYIYVVIGFCVVLEALNIIAKNAAEKSAMQIISGTQIDESEISVQKANHDEE